MGQRSFTKLNDDGSLWYEVWEDKHGKIHGCGVNDPEELFKLLVKKDQEDIEKKHRKRREQQYLKQQQEKETRLKEITKGEQQFAQENSGNLEALINQFQDKSDEDWQVYIRYMELNFRWRNLAYKKGFGEIWQLLYWVKSEGVSPDPGNWIPRTELLTWLINLCRLKDSSDITLYSVEEVSQVQQQINAEKLKTEMEKKKEEDALSQRAEEQRKQLDEEQKLEKLKHERKEVRKQQPVKLKEKQRLLQEKPKRRLGYRLGHLFFTTRKHADNDARTSASPVNSYPR